MKTMTEIMIGEKESEHYALVMQNLALVLDFVERHNKFDKETKVAYAAHFLEGIIKK